MKRRKATHGQLRRENRQLLLRAVYSGLANSRADLAQETGLAKPTVSDLISHLIKEGYLIETGFGQSTDEGGKRPRLLEFVPDARHVIGISVDSSRIQGVVANLEGRVLVQHYHEWDGTTQGQAIHDLLTEVINGLLAQLDAPLLCLGIGVPGLVDSRTGIVRYAPHLGWQNVALADILSKRYHVPAYVANNTELAAMAEFAFGHINGANSLVTVLVDDSVGVGSVLDGAIYHSGGEIGQLFLISGSGQTLESHLGWSSVKQRLEMLQHKYTLTDLPGDTLTYLHVRRAISEGDVAALALQDELAGYLAQIFAWVIALLRPDHISLCGPIADLGDPLLTCAIEHTGQLLVPDLMRTISFSLNNTSSLVAIGAVAQTLQRELGLV